MQLEQHNALKLLHSVNKYPKSTQEINIMKIDRLNHTLQKPQEKYTNPSLKKHSGVHILSNVLEKKRGNSSKSTL